MSRCFEILVAVGMLVPLVGCGQSDKSTAEQNKVLVHSFIDAFNARKYEAVREMMDDDFIRYSRLRVGEELLSTGVAMKPPWGEVPKASIPPENLERLSPQFDRKMEGSPYEVIQSRDQFIQSLKANGRAFPSGHLSLLKIVAADDLVGFLVVYEGTQEGEVNALPALHKKLRLDILGMCRITHGKLADLWLKWDTMDALMQLGHHKPPPYSE